MRYRGFMVTSPFWHQWKNKVLADDDYDFFRDGSNFPADTIQKALKNIKFLMTNSKYHGIVIGSDWKPKAKLMHRKDYP